MKSDLKEIKCGNCHYWQPWTSVDFPGSLSVRKAIQKGKETGCDGKCCCYKSGMTIGPTDSSDTLSAQHCDNYSPIGG